ncbi:MAG: class I SAM-dependent methyltransferase [Opitutaceae bacterium]|nr:class I SAM-dependent methyltransferase [Opitutaceae bacterium]
MIDRRAKLMQDNETVVREIDPAWKNFYLGLWNEGVIGDLCARRLLIETQLEVKEGDGSGLLRFCQPRLPLITYPHEWSALMFRSAAENCLLLHEALFERGLCLVDSHPWNIVFDGVKPLWVDLTSIDHFSPMVAHGSLHQFRNSFLNTLYLLVEGHEELARSILAHSFSSIGDEYLRVMLSGGKWQRHSWRIRIPKGFYHAQMHAVKVLVAEWRRFFHFRSHNFSTPERAKAVVTRLRNELAKIPLGIGIYEWTNYVQAGQSALTLHEIESRALGTERYENAKVRAVDKWLSGVNGEVCTVLDLGCNKGLFAQIARMRGFTVAGIDTDPGAIDDMYAFTAYSNMSISCGIVDFVSPREGVGMLTNPLPSVVERMRSDLVLCVAVTHHLYFGRYHMSFDLIVRLLAMYSKKYVIVEFVPKEDSFLKGYYPESTNEARYTSEGFAQAVSQVFQILEVHPSIPEGRSLFFLKKYDVAPSSGAQKRVKEMRG